MDRFGRNPPLTGGPRSRTPNLKILVVLSLLVLGLLLGTAALSAVPALSPVTAPAALGHAVPRSAGLHVLPSAVGPAATHGDLVVNAANSPFIISPLTTGSGTYDQAGNITVLTGGTLIVKNETVRFFQYVSDTGNLGQRLTHLYHVAVQGSATFVNSTVTTDAQSINAFTKLPFNVSAGGRVSLQQSTFAFPGSIGVNGASSYLNLSQSTITSNPVVKTVSENISLLHDTEFAPILTVGGGAHVVLANSVVENYYKNNLTHYGGPGPAPVNSNGLHQLSNTGGSTWSTWVTPTDSENVSRAVLYPQIASGFIGFAYTTQVDQTIAAGNSLTVTGAVPLGGIAFPHLKTYLQFPLPAAMITQINTIGIPAYLNASGDYATPATTSLTLGATNTAFSLNITQVSLNLSGAVQYNIGVSGAATVFTAVDSSLDINWNLTPNSPYSPGSAAPTPWGSNKLLLTAGAHAYLANLTVPNARNGVFFYTSAVLPDPTSQAYLYRWLIVPVTGLGGLPVSNAQATPFYSYDTNQLNNNTATTLNNLATANPDLFAYVTAFDKAQGAAGYGLSTLAGQSWLLVAASWLNQTTIPNGVFLGGYHIAVTIAGLGAGGVKYVYSSVTPYPQGMNPAAPDVSSGVNYSTYAPKLGFTNVNVTADGKLVSPATVSIGQAMKVSATVANTGVAPSLTYVANLTYFSTFPPVGGTQVAPPQNFPALPAGSNRPLNISWVVNQTVTGLHGWINTSFTLSIVWGGGHPPGGGVLVQTIPATIAPSQISVTLVAPKGNYVPPQEYPVSGTVTFNGSGQATIIVNAVGSSGVAYPVAVAHSPPGAYLSTLIPDPTMPPGTYNLVVTATFNGRTSSQFVLAGQMTIPGATTGPQAWYNATYFGLALWLWILIGALVAVGAVGGFLYYSRYAARGKLVECGECGELIPESATVCPKCGAEFEAGLVRCSRCSSTIPADSKVCPECSAQLLGSPEEGARDPERQGYADFVERYRAESKKELQDNYSEGAFWDWWKRQATYVPFSQWRLQQSQGSRVGMSAPPAGAAMTEAAVAPIPAAAAPRVAVAAPVARAAAPPPVARAPPPSRPVTPTPPPVAEAPAPVAPAPATAAGLKACSNCGREIPSDYLVCPFCGAVTR